MKKNGFTLSELLITLTIIGIAAAISAPALTRLMPQKDKMQVIKYYHMVDNATDELLNTEGVYVLERNGDGVITCEGFACTKQPSVFPYNNNADADKYSGNLKLPNLLADKLSLAQQEVGPGKDFWRGSASDGSVWLFEDLDEMQPNLSGTIHLTIDINGIGKGEDNNFKLSNMDDKGSINKPDRFMFEIDKFGDIKGFDPLTKVYLSNPINMHRKKEDKELALEYLKEDFRPQNPGGTTPTIKDSGDTWKDVSGSSIVNKTR